MVGLMFSNSIRQKPFLLKKNNHNNQKTFRLIIKSSLISLQSDINCLEYDEILDIVFRGNI